MNISTYGDDNNIRSSTDALLLRPSEFGNETGGVKIGSYEHGVEVKEMLENDCKVLVLGAGGLGCELLKDLALSGFNDIHVIDMDTIDLTNLNRQFLFRKKDVNEYKSVVASKFIMERIPGCKVTPYTCKLQDLESEMEKINPEYEAGDFFKEFSVVISGLDNIEARDFMNKQLFDLVEYEKDGSTKLESCIPYIDGGTEAFNGQVRVMIPGVTYCFHCSMDLFPPQVKFQSCTIANTPRKPEHCIIWAYTIAWEAEHGVGQKMDKDSPDHMKWVYDKALERAAEFDIDGVTYFKTMGVVKNIIPAVASTNAIISAMCVNEALKISTWRAQTKMNYYMMYVGTSDTNVQLSSIEIKDQCATCGVVVKAIEISSEESLESLIHEIRTNSELILSLTSKGLLK